MNFDEMEVFAVYRLLLGWESVWHVCLTLSPLNMRFPGFANIMHVYEMILNIWNIKYTNMTFARNKQNIVKTEDVQE